MQNYTIFTTHSVFGKGVIKTWSEAENEASGLLLSGNLTDCNRTIEDITCVRSEYVCNESLSEKTKAALNAPEPDTPAQNPCDKGNRKSNALISGLVYGVKNVEAESEEEATEQVKTSHFAGFSWFESDNVCVELDPSSDVAEAIKAAQFLSRFCDTCGDHCDCCPFWLPAYCDLQEYPSDWTAVHPGEFPAALRNLAATELAKPDDDRTYTVTEWCANCESEVEMTWNTDVDGFKAFCPSCGAVLMLCDECKHCEDNPYDRCDWYEDENGVGHCFRTERKAPEA